jgi:S-adenosylmethionine decarboxylase
MFAHKLPHFSIPITNFLTESPAFSEMTGTHFICDVFCENEELLKENTSLRAHIERWLSQVQLTTLGVIAHDFSPCGFTLVFCLSESHLSVHTFPEKGLVALDVYLSNFRRDNTETGRKLIELFVEFFCASSYSLQEIKRG